MSWEEKMLDELGDIGRGKSRHRPRNDEKLYGGNYPFIQTGDIQKANLYINSYEKTYSEFGLAQSKLWNAGTLCLSIVGANTAESAILGIDACFPDSVIGFNGHKGVADNHFIKYYLDTIKIELKRISEGTARENLSMEKLLSKKRPFPPYSVQKKIASILSAYDDLIENNLKRIKLLEEAAQNIYKEWFVNFRFPGWQNAKFDKESGLPEGWRKQLLANIIQTVKRKPKLKKDFYLDEGNYPIIDQGDGYIAGYTNDEELVQKTPLPLVVFGDHTRRIKFINFPFVSGADGTQLIYPKNEKLLPSYFYHAIKSIDLSNYAYARHFKFLKEQEIILPESTIIDRFNNLTSTMNNQIIKLINYNQKLKEARDILLPRLMNRTINV